MLALGPPGMSDGSKDLCTALTPVVSQRSHPLTRGNPCIVVWRLVVYQISQVDYVLIADFKAFILGWK